MALAKFKFFPEKLCIQIIGQDFNLKSIEGFYKILIKVEKEKSIKHLKIAGNFKSELFLKDICLYNNFREFEEYINFFHKIAKIIEDSKVVFTSVLSGVVKGPAMEIALLCNFLRAKPDTVFSLDYADHGKMPYFGTTQRLTRLIGYQNTLKAFLIEKSITYKKGLELNLFNHDIDNLKKIKKSNMVWDNIFTNTFIFYNSKIHSTFKNKKPAYNAILSTIFESCVCHKDVGVEVEKRWLKWLIDKKHKKVLKDT